MGREKKTGLLPGLRSAILDSQRGSRSHRCFIRAASFMAAFLILIVGTSGSAVKAAGDGSTYMEITATLEKPTVSGNKPKPKPPGGDDHHHGGDDDDDTPPKKPTEETKTPELPVVPVVYLPGPGVTKLKAVPVPGERIIQKVTETVTGNEAVLPEPRAPMKLSVSGNTVSGNKNSKDGDSSKPVETIRAVSLEEKTDHMELWVIWLLLLGLMFILSVWLLLIRKHGKRKPEAEESPESETYDEENGYPVGTDESGGYPEDTDEDDEIPEDQDVAEIYLAETENEDRSPEKSSDD